MQGAQDEEMIGMKIAAKEKWGYVFTDKITNCSIDVTLYLLNYVHKTGYVFYWFDFFRM